MRLISFNFLVQSIIQQVTTAAPGGRKKKSAEEGNSLHDWLASLGDGGVQSLTYEIAATIIPLAVIIQNSD